MEPKLACLGSSLSVPCVQAGTALTHQVPPRYLLPEQDPQFLSNYATTSMPHFLIINFRCLLSADFLDSELEKLHRACLELGFFPGIISVYIMYSIISYAALLGIYTYDPDKIYVQEGQLGINVKKKSEVRMSKTSDHWDPGNRGS